jgi:hypothetical protein
VCKNPFYIVCLFDFDTDANRVDGRFYQHMFVLITGDVHWIQNDLGGRPYLRQNTGQGGAQEGELLCFYFGDVVPFDDLA